ncbi:hypothetical protein ZHAS_00021580 [Anopheles sinensis]|uniref:Uncharacterized protein n=1 Tax=Anopheles sinensis TaxID=74873 RepID=A0A084WST2_ANOSI|nr:hypothetical protein ZHAS_00021580 [Anopheles sinensis]
MNAISTRHREQVSSIDRNFAGQTATPGPTPGGELLPVQHMQACAVRELGSITASPQVQRPKRSSAAREAGDGARKGFIPQATPLPVGCVGNEGGSRSLGRTPICLSSAVWVVAVFFCGLHLAIPWGNRIFRLICDSSLRVKRTVGGKVYKARVKQLGYIGLYTTGDNVPSGRGVILLESLRVWRVYIDGPFRGRSSPGEVNMLD